MPIPEDYEVRVYAGVLGKLIGVYLGRPFEGWSNRRIEAELGEVWYYVHDRLGKALIVSDDDISGTFTFVRALEDHGISRDLTVEQIGRTWLNYLIEERTILWWGGMGTSTEHTAYLRLKHGIPAPQSGSMALNTRVVSEQIGAQIFIDGWAMVAPGEPDLAVDLAGKASRVSHDGEAVYGAQVLAAMESAAFFETDLEALFDLGMSYIPADSVIARLINDVRAWHAKDGDWRATFRRIEDRYGYNTYGGGCHMVPNHAVIALALLYGGGDFQRSLMIANTAGWDTDCNSGNVGCLLGIRNGLQGIDAGPDWRGPVADRLFKISADGGDGITDAVRETFRLCRIGRALLGAPPQAAPKDGARFHFSLPGSVQGFCPDDAPECRGAVTVGHSGNALSVRLDRIGPGRPGRVLTPVYGTPDELARGGYRMELSPSLYPGQMVTAVVVLDDQTTGAVHAALCARTFPEAPGSSGLPLHTGQSAAIKPGGATRLSFIVPDTGGLPVVSVGIEMRADRVVSGMLFLDALTWSGAPTCGFFGPGMAAHGRPLGWTNGVSALRLAGADGVSLIQNEGRGLLMTGEHGWADYRFSAKVTPHLAREAGIAVRVGGMRRFYSLLLCADGVLRLMECRHDDVVLAEAPCPWEAGVGRVLTLAANGDRLTGELDGRCVFSVTHKGFSTGGVALIQTEGRSQFTEVTVERL